MANNNAHLIPTGLLNGPIPSNNNYKYQNNSIKNQENALSHDDKALRLLSGKQGQEYLDRWLSTRQHEIEKIMSMFTEDGKPKQPPTATTFSDLYKWTMMPVVRKLEQVKGKIIVTFGIDLRDEAMKAALLADKQLRDNVVEALNSLRDRPFNKDIFTAVNTFKKGILSQSDIDASCDSGNLVDGEPTVYFEVNSTEELQQRPEFIASKSGDDVVRVLFYKNKGVHFIEATGPWHRVTWLETSLMQCVYEAKLRYDLAKKGKTYKQWLYGALLRCAKSIAYTKNVKRLLAKDGSDDVIKGALFTGRRTGGLLFLLLQNMMFAEYLYDALGTSSVDCWYILNNMGYHCLSPSGTHAHEMSMVTSALFPELDQNPLHLPITQVLGHYLYYKLAWSKTGGPMPMLPDTLGTPAFLKTASYIHVDGAPFLEKITFARQDSGELEDFLENLGDYGKRALPVMASEIDTTITLLEAAKLGYKTFGAGGFFGDSEKVWGDKKTPSNSMAVKAVRVMYAGQTDGSIPYIKQDGTNVIGYPVKIGDPSDRTRPQLAQGKLSLDKNLDERTYDAVKAYAENVRVSAAPGTPRLAETKPLSEILASVGLSEASFQGGRRKTKRVRRHKKAKKTRGRR
jgi:nicotinic acid phosphoribosyltransferase